MENTIPSTALKQASFIMLASFQKIFLTSFLVCQPMSYIMEIFTIQKPSCVYYRVYVFLLSLLLLRKKHFLKKRLKSSAVVSPALAILLQSRGSSIPGNSHLAHHSPGFSFHVNLNHWQSSSLPLCCLCIV